MTKKVTEHATGLGEILFMAAAKALTNQKTQKTEFSIKLKLPENDAAVEHLREIASYKVDTKTNRAMAGSGEVVINFTSEYQPKVLGSDNEELTDQAIPYFDGRKDTGTAAVTYKVITYDNGNSIVRLSGIKLISLNQTPREEGGQTLDVTLETLKNIS